jgi:predicted RNase H-like HicB family nuclease
MEEHSVNPEGEWVAVEKFTAVFERGEQGWWVATCPEIPGAVSQGKTIDEAREMLRDAIELLLEVRRKKGAKEHAGREVVREPLIL